MNQIAYINDVAYPIAIGESMLDFLKRHKGLDYIPTLCDAPNLTAGGACRLCNVDVSNNEDGQLNTVASCHTNVYPDARIYPNTDRIQHLRKNIVELVISDHPLDCLTCEANGDCQLQDVAARVGINEVRYAEGASHALLKRTCLIPI